MRFFDELSKTSGFHCRRNAKLRSQAGARSSRIAGLLSTTVAHPTFVHGALRRWRPRRRRTRLRKCSKHMDLIAFLSMASRARATGETIAIVDAYDDPNIQSDLNTFDTQFGLPATTVTRVNETGGTSYPASDSTGGWELEESLDVEWAHAMAPRGEHHAGRGQLRQ